MNKIEDETIIKVINNVHKMLINRGHDATQLNDTEPFVIKLNKINQFREQTDNPILDIYINSKRKVYVKFINKMQNNKSSRELIRLYDFFTNAYRFNSKDDVIFIIFDDLGEDVFNIEDKYPNVTVFNYKKLLINIVEHIYVPRHIKIPSKEHKTLKEKLMIKNLDQLPLLSKKDAISKYYNYRIGDVIRVERPSDGNMRHIAYRYVVEI